MSDAPSCPAGHPMVVRDRFRFDHEPGDTPRDSFLLARFAEAGVELGAEVTLYYCAACDYAQAAFAYPDPGDEAGTATP